MTDNFFLELENDLKEFRKELDERQSLLEDYLKRATEPEALLRDAQKQNRAIIPGQKALLSFSSVTERLQNLLQNLETELNNLVESEEVRHYRILAEDIEAYANSGGDDKAIRNKLNTLEKSKFPRLHIFLNARYELAKVLHQLKQKRELLRTVLSGLLKEYEELTNPNTGQKIEKARAYLDELWLLRIVEYVYFKEDAEVRKIWEDLFQKFARLISENQQGSFRLDGYLNADYLSLPLPSFQIPDPHVEEKLNTVAGKLGLLQLLAAVGIVAAVLATAIGGFGLFLAMQAPDTSALVTADENFEADIVDLGESIAEVTESLSDLETMDEGLNDRIATLEAQGTALQNQMNSLLETTAEAPVIEEAGLNPEPELTASVDVSPLETEIASLRTEISDLQTQVAALEAAQFAETEIPTETEEPTVTEEPTETEEPTVTEEPTDEEQGEDTGGFATAVPTETEEQAVTIQSTGNVNIRSTPVQGENEVSSMLPNTDYTVIGFAFASSNGRMWLLIEFTDGLGQTENGWIATFAGPFIMTKGSQQRNITSPQDAQQAIEDFSIPEYDPITLEPVEADSNSSDIETE